MKQLAILLPLILAAACHAPAPTSATTEVSTSITTKNPIKNIVFTTGSRGYQKEITLTKDSAILIINSSFEERPSKNLATTLSVAEWDKLLNSLNGVLINQLNNLKSPTMRRAVDAASHSTIVITTDKEYSHAFDDYTPHEQLQKLMAVITEIENDRNQ